MDTKVSKKILFWAVLGPFLFVVALLIYQLHTGPKSFTLALIGSGAVLASVVWRSRGLAVVLGSVGATLFWLYGDIPLASRFWHIGWTASLGLTATITALSMNEVRELLGYIQRESAARLDQLWQLDEKFKEVQERRRLEREDHEVRSKLADQEIAEIKGHSQNQQETLELARAELEQQRQVRERLSAELLQEHRKNAKLEIELSEKKIEVSACSPAVRTDADREIARLQGMLKQLREQFDEKNEVLKQTRSELFAQEGKVHILQQQIEELKRDDGASVGGEVQTALTELQTKDDEIAALNALVTNLMEEISLVRDR